MAKQPKQNLTIKKSELQKLLSRLGELNAEIRKIHITIREKPEFVVQMTRQYLTDFIKANKWFLKKTATKEEYWKLINFALRGDKPLLSKKKSRPLLTVELTWEVYPKTLAGKPVSHPQLIELSVFNDLETQIKNGMTPTTVNEKTIKTQVLLAQKKDMEAKLREIKLQINAL